MNPRTHRNLDDAPLVTLGQGDYQRYLRPSDLEPRQNSGELPRAGEDRAQMMFVFVLGLLMGGMLW